MIKIAQRRLEAVTKLTAAQKLYDDIIKIETFCLNYAKNINDTFVSSSNSLEMLKGFVSTFEGNEQAIMVEDFITAQEKVLEECNENLFKALLNALAYEKKARNELLNIDFSKDKLFLSYSEKRELLKIFEQIS